MISIKKLLDRFRLHNADEYAEAEGDKLGTLRGGGTGCFYRDGRNQLKVTGKCPRLSHLRSLGIQPSNDEHSQHMFDGGYANEHRWVEKMKAVWKGTVRTEEEIPMIWSTTNGTVVTGRPDIVLCLDSQSIDGPEPMHGLELKNVSSLWTAREVLFKGRPKMNHLLQSGHYSLKLGVPWSLCYTSSSKYPVIESLGKTKIRWPESGAALSEHVEYDQWGDGKPFARSIQPFVQIYDIDSRSDLDCIRYRIEGTTEWTETNLSANGIIAYYEHVSKIKETGDLGPRPTELKVDGARESYSQCDGCPFAKACDNYDGGRKRGSPEGHQDYEQWITEIGETY